MRFTAYRSSTKQPNGLIQKQLSTYLFIYHSLSLRLPKQKTVMRRSKVRALKDTQTGTAQLRLAVRIAHIEITRTKLNTLKCFQVIICFVALRYCIQQAFRDMKY